MANGVLCRCGYQQGDHFGGIADQYAGDFERMKKDHPKLVKCSGYRPIEKFGLVKQDDATVTKEM